MQQPTMNTLVLLALTAPLLASPLPRRDITVRYTPNYANPPTPRSPSPERDTLEEDLVTISPTPSRNELEDILSIQKPLPSIFLMNLSKLRGDKADEGVNRRQDGEEGQVVEGKEAEATQTVRVSPEARGVNEERSVFVSDARHLCPFAGLVVFWTLGFLACAIQRWRKPRGEIYLDIEKPQRHSLSLRADEEVAEAK